jgi:hypothetical protein
LSILNSQNRSTCKLHHCAILQMGTGITAKLSSHAEPGLDSVCGCVMGIWDAVLRREKSLFHHSWKQSWAFRLIFKPKRFTADLSKDHLHGKGHLILKWETKGVVQSFLESDSMGKALEVKGWSILSIFFSRIRGSPRMLILSGWVTIQWRELCWSLGPVNHSSWEPGPWKGPVQHNHRLPAGTGHLPQGLTTILSPSWEMAKCPSPGNQRLT